MATSNNSNPGTRSLPEQPPAGIFELNRNARDLERRAGSSDGLPSLVSARANGTDKTFGAGSIKAPPPRELQNAAGDTSMQ